MRSLEAKETYNHSMSGVPVCRVIKKEHERSREAETMGWARQDEERAVKTVILSDDTAANREAKRFTREKEAKVGAGV
jgi:hypothetical protein